MEKFTAKELRIGNLLKYKDSLLKVSKISSDSYSCNVLTNTGFSFDSSEESFAEPIPLNEDWLLQLGAKIETELHYKFERFILGWNNMRKYYYILDDDTSIYLTKVEFVHEWQNFVFVMDGKELEFNK